VVRCRVNSIRSLQAELSRTRESRNTRSLELRFHALLIEDSVRVLFHRGASPGLVRPWDEDAVITYVAFASRPRRTTTGAGNLELAPIGE
jgi:hypothetical protein